MSPRPYVVEFSAQAIADLRGRIRAARWPEAEPVDDWSQGVPLAYLRQICDHWADDYDFAAAQTRLNAFPQYQTQIDGLRIHHLHVRSRHPRALPLLLTHGWPGSFVEFLDVVPLLTDPPDPADAFDIVVPSLPGFGFSEKPAVAGSGVDRIAHAWNDLMSELGYERYGVQGGDWGAMVSTRVAQLHPDRVLGAHVNMPVVGLAPHDLEDPSPAEERWLERMAEHQTSGRGYSELQATRPQTIGYGLTDSAVGQCAWILEKFWAWTDNDGHPEDVLSKDRLLDNISRNPAQAALSSAWSSSASARSIRAFATASSPSSAPT